jgi:hypothetical protein
MITMKHSILLLLILALSPLCGSPSLHAQYAIDRSVFGLGGTETKGAQNRIIGTLGQTLIGVAENPTTIQQAGFWYGVHSVPVGITLAAALPGILQLGQNYPNPVRGTATIPFSIQRSAHVRLTVSSVLGEEMQVLLNGDMRPGLYHARFDGTRYPAGMYFIRLQAGAQVVSRSFVVRR